MEQNSNNTQNKNNTTINHAIMLPLHLQGHINPFIQLSLNLILKGCKITFLTFEHVHKFITHASKSDTNNLFKDIKQPSDTIRYRVVSDGLPIDYNRSGNLMKYLEWNLNGGLYDILVNEIGKIILESNPKVNVLIVDTFYPWASKIAKKFGLKCASFWTEPAIVFDLYYHVHLLRQNGHFDCSENRKDPIDYIPGINSIDPKDLVSYLQDKDTSTNMHKLIFQAYQDIRSIDYILCNTIQDFEPNTISALQKLIPFYPIGPILLSSPTKNTIPTSFWAESNCLEWLKPKSNGSVLYVSFGSLAKFAKNELLEIAYGLLDSNIDFIWIHRPGTVFGATDNIFPIGFEDEIRGRGLIVPWTNQIAVLSSQAVGGFLTHCGWNSVLESIMYEKPMLCFPLFSDQFTNRKLVVDDWEIGVNLCNASSTIHRNEIATQIKSFMSQISRENLKKNICDKKNMLQSALEIGGSSDTYLEQFIEQLSK